MPAVVRVKRRMDEEPLEAFVLNGKKRRIEKDTQGSTQVCPIEEKEEVTTILKFAGTVQSQDLRTTAQVARLTKDEAIDMARKRRIPVNTRERLREEIRNNSKESRFKVVNCSRTLDTETEESIPTEITIVDIEKQPPLTPQSAFTSTSGASSSYMSTIPSASSYSTNNYSMPPEIGENAIAPTDSDGYVYDLYVPENDQQAENLDYSDNFIRIKALDAIVFEDCPNSDNESDKDSDESFPEGYDYPEEEDGDDSMSDARIANAVNNLNIGSDEDRPSSGEDGDYYNNYLDDFERSDYSNSDSDEDVDPVDVNHYGTAYAKYKARFLKLNPQDNDDEED